MAKAKAEREQNDNYPTPQELAEAMIRRVLGLVGPTPSFDWLIEPSAGNGVFVHYMRQAWPTKTIVAVELRQAEEERLKQVGATYVSIMPFEDWAMHHAPREPALVIGNPPFTLAQLHLERMFQFFPHGSEIALLLRFSFFGGKQRNLTFWMNSGMRYLKHIIPIAPRPNFVRGTSDNSEYAVFLWKVGHSDPATILDPILWEKRRPVRRQP